MGSRQRRRRIHPELFQQNVGAAVSEGDDQIHEDKRQVIVPPGRVLTPESGVPDQDLFLNGAEHDENQSERSELSQDASGDAEGSSDFGDPEKDCEAFGHLDALGARFGIFQMTVAAGGEDQSDHKAEQQNAKVGETG